MNDEMISLRELGVFDPAQLPDWCFGDRRALSIEGGVPVSGVLCGGSGVSLAPKIVVWEVGAWVGYGCSAGTYFRIGLVSSDPATEAAVLLGRPLLEGFGAAGVEPRKIYMDRYTSTVVVTMRRFVTTESLRLGCVIVNGGATFGYARVWVVYSAVPTALPAWAARHLGFNV